MISSPLLTAAFEGLRTFTSPNPRHLWAQDCVMPIEHARRSLSKLREAGWMISGYADLVLDEAAGSRGFL